MRHRRTASGLLFSAAPAGLALLLALTSCHEKPEHLIGGDNSVDYGHPISLSAYMPPNDQNDIGFVLIADTHLDQSYAGLIPGHDHEGRDTDDAFRNRKVISVINWRWEHNEYGPLLGVVHLGDMIDSKGTCQNIISYRQWWERDYALGTRPAIAGADDDDGWAYNTSGHRCELPVFPGEGNHDVVNYGSGQRNLAAYYVDDLIHNTSVGNHSWYAHPGDYISGYCWRWGRFFCVQLGLCGDASSCQRDNYSYTDKLEWLQSVLASGAGDSLPVIIFQHYGWDNSGSQSFWSADSRRRMLNVLCNRPIDDTTTLQWNPPYNVVAIFSGHTHQQYQPIRVFACTYWSDVFFDNMVLGAAGKTDTTGRFGFSVCRAWSHVDGYGKIRCDSVIVYNESFSSYSQPDGFACDTVRVPDLHHW